MWNGNQGTEYEDNPLCKRIKARNSYPSDERIAKDENSKYVRCPSANADCSLSHDSTPKQASQSHRAARSDNGGKSIRKNGECCTGNEKKSNGESNSEPRNVEWYLGSELRNNVDGHSFNAPSSSSVISRGQMKGDERSTVNSAGKTAQPSSQKAPRKAGLREETPNQNASRVKARGTSKQAERKTKSVTISQNSGQQEKETISDISIQQTSAARASKGAKEKRWVPISQTSKQSARETRPAPIQQPLGQPASGITSVPISKQPARDTTSVPIQQTLGEALNETKWLPTQQTKQKSARKKNRGRLNTGRVH